MQSSERKSRIMLILSMCIFSTVGILRKFIPYSSSMIAMVRGIVGALFLIVVVLISRKPINKSAVKSNLLLLIVSGAAIGFNWILLFESYCYTSVATATLCYYLAPIIVILASPFVLKESFTWKKSICTFVALLGMILVSGVLESSFSGIQEFKGILLGIGAAILYGSVILMNKKMKPIPAYEKTIIQLTVASAAMIPYVLLTEDTGSLQLLPVPVFLLLVAGIVHTGIAYWLYFGSMQSLKSHTVALLSYIDPILAIVLSMLLLKEPMSASAAVGAVLILGAAIISER